MTNELTLEKAQKKLIDWIELWDKVCNAADPDDTKPLPKWEEVMAQVLPEWEPCTVEFWSEYMKAMLVYEVRDFARLAALNAGPRQPEQ